MHSFFGVAILLFFAFILYHFVICRLESSINKCETWQLYIDTWAHYSNNRCKHCTYYYVCCYCRVCGMLCMYPFYFLYLGSVGFKHSKNKICISKWYSYSTHTFLLVKLYRFTGCSSFSSLHHSSVCTCRRHWQTMTVDKSRNISIFHNIRILCLAMHGASTFNNLDTNERFTRIFSYAFRSLNS